MTYLYIKRHKDTGLMYFGKTIRNDPEKYKGSGTVWKRHLKKHGNNIETIWLQKFTDQNDLIEFATFFSEVFDIVNSKQWANLMGENGIDGGSSNISEETRLRMSLSAKARIDNRFDLNSLERKPHTEESKKLISKALTGKKKTDTHKINLWVSRGGKHSEETKQKMREGHARRKLEKNGNL